MLYILQVQLRQKLKPKHAQDPRTSIMDPIIIFYIFHY